MSEIFWIITAVFLKITY